MLQSMGSQRVGHDLVSKQEQRLRSFVWDTTERIGTRIKIVEKLQR